MSFAHNAVRKNAKDESAVSRKHKNAQAVIGVTPVTKTGLWGKQFPLQRKENTCACGGGCPKCLKKLGIQAKIRIGAANDNYEQEADRVADLIVQMPDPRSSLVSNEPLQNNAISSVGPIQRKCASCAESEELIREKPAGRAACPTITPTMNSNIQALQGGGRTMSGSDRSFFEPRFGADFSHVRVHSDGRAANVARSANARAFTLGTNVVFGAGEYSPNSASGKRLFAHELTHVLQQSAGVIKSGSVIQRACLSASVCAAPIPGSAEEFSASEELSEAPLRSRRSRMSPARARASGHAGHARQLERFLEAHTPGLLSNIHGIFVDQDMSQFTGAFLSDCATFDPPITGATKPCMFVPARLNQEALRFNTEPTAVRIGRFTREDWRVFTLQTLTHEVQHALFNRTPRATPAGVGAGCPRSIVEFELSELNSIMSEFPIAFRAVPAGAGVSDPARVRLDNWFTEAITNSSESIQGALTKMRCACDCADVDRYIVDTFNFTASSWTTAEKTAFNTELRRPVWALRWPL